MAPRVEQSLQQTPGWQDSNGPTDTEKYEDQYPGAKMDLRPSVAVTLEPDPTTALETDFYPEGGLEGWLVVLGAFCGLTASLGLYNTVGTFSAVIGEHVLPDEPPSTLGWIFGVYAFITWFCGVQIGPTFDAMGPRALIAAGSVCTLVGIFGFSFATSYYQIVLSFSILTAIGSSLLLTPSMACVAHWFLKRRGLASGIAFIGGGFGGVLFPLMIQALLPQVGWAWSVRIMGFVLLLLCAVSVTLCKSRISPRNGSNTTWRDTLPTARIFKDDNGAMAITTLGALLTDLAYYIPIAYIPSYYIARQGIPRDESLTGSAAFAYQLLAILNTASCFGRAIAGGLGDCLGYYNTMIVSLTFCTISVLGFWLGDILSEDLHTSALIILFVLLFGFVSGSNVSLLPVCLGHLCDVQDYGRYYASCFTIVSFGVLVSVPIAGALLDVSDATGKRRYWAAALFTGISYVVSLLCFVWVRVRVKGWDWRHKW